MRELLASRRARLTPVEAGLPAWGGHRWVAEVPHLTPIGREYGAIVEEIGSGVRTVRPGDFVVGGFLTSDNTCPHCRAGQHANCQHGGSAAASPSGSAPLLPAAPCWPPPASPTRTSPRACWPCPT
ncbi:alcohol dehydrogenase catalytic domain-containing protein [Cellulomonas soli]|uniref:alcohol dehydrogenase catalytic domain-containing protein n=1 Tax=Cellulomonas soli TaxID=931535 RepID=UPI003F87641B